MPQDNWNSLRARSSSLSRLPLCPLWITQPLAECSTWRMLEERQRNLCPNVNRKSHNGPAVEQVFCVGRLIRASPT
jgi:hypothetical protein